MTLFVENTFYTFDTQRTAEGKFYTTNALKFPIKMGITGHIFDTNIDMLALEDPRKNKYFQPEIDNTSNAPAVKNLIIGNSQAF